MLTTAQQSDSELQQVEPVMISSQACKIVASILPVFVSTVYPFKVSLG